MLLRKIFHTDHPVPPPRKSMLHLAIGLIVFGLLLFFVGGSITLKRRGGPVPELSELQNLQTDKAETYVKITVTRYIPFLYSIENDNDNYFFFFDENQQAYIVRASSSNEATIAQALKDGYAVELYGTLYDINDALRKEAIDAAGVIFTDVEINEQNFKDYFGSTYLNFGEHADSPLSVFASTLAGFSFVSGVVILSIYFILVKRSKLSQ